jgi:hypothetical protein
MAVMAYNCGELARLLSGSWSEYFAKMAALLRKYEVAAMQQELVIDLTREEIEGIRRVAASLLHLPKTYAATAGIRMPTEAVQLLITIGETLSDPRNRLPWGGEILAEAALNLKSLGERAPVVNDRIRLVSLFELSSNLTMLGEAFNYVADEMRLDLPKQ